MGYFLGKAREVDVPTLDRLIRSGTGEEWVRLSWEEKQNVCEEAARRIETSDPEVTSVYYRLYLDYSFQLPRLRSLRISDLLIEAEIRKQEGKTKTPQKRPEKLDFVA